VKQDIELKKTALWQLHKDLQATMGPFAGWDMPMIYKSHSIPESVKVVTDLFNYLLTYLNMFQVDT